VAEGLTSLPERRVLLVDDRGAAILTFPLP
jgi:hypothetical protein